ncbi:MAG: nitroreductase family deazaflavin-dependent oxidoreductase [Deltaproteobacteria bacterium]|nr:nitroreductase family deazaflavin-dependent oxidoreductase [Deltaproteobacteria bacterium]
MLAALGPPTCFPRLEFPGYTVIQLEPAVMSERKLPPWTPSQEGERVVLVASKGGMSKHPVWYLNLVANPRCSVEIGREKRAMRARTANAEEKAALWPRLVAMYRDYDDYQSRTDREIPVVVLDPVA